MELPTFVFIYEIRYKGQVSITAEDQHQAFEFWKQLQLANLVTHAGQPSINLDRVDSNCDDRGGGDFIDY
jgi:hypothetical protein